MVRTSFAPVFTSTLCLVLALASACEGTSPGDGSESGATAADETGSDSETGTSGSESESTSESTSSSSTDSSSTSEASGETSSEASSSTSSDTGETGGCDPEPMEALPPEVLPRCNADTGACLRACDAEDWNCQEACLAADTMAADPDWQIDCNLCTFWQYAVCVQDNGCKAEVDAYQCCAQAQGDDACTAELDNIYTCGFSFAQGCGDAFLAGDDGCFAEPEVGAQ